MGKGDEVGGVLQSLQDFDDGFPIETWVFVVKKPDQNKIPEQKKNQNNSKIGSNIYLRQTHILKSSCKL